MTDPKGTVTGPRDQHRVVFYGLSTCIWCKKTRQFLEGQGVTFDYFYVDLLQGEERERILERVRQWNPAISFPTLVVDDTQCVIGYRPQEIGEALGL